MTRKPEWLRIHHGAKNLNIDTVESIIKKLDLNTVCAEANCPNYSECFSRETATFMILGKHCSRDCRFCNVRHDSPLPPKQDEPENIARAVKELELRYVVITSVTRDDLDDGGAGHFAKTLRAIREYSPVTAVELLIPDFKGDIAALKTVTDAGADVISHNMETVPALYHSARPQAEYRRSLEVLKNIKRLNPRVRSKSGFMLGLGETEEQVHQLLDDLREADCEFLTIGQYLAPSREHLPAREYITPRQFEEYGEVARKKGFVFVASAPLARSSYRAGEALGIL